MAETITDMVYSLFPHAVNLCNGNIHDAEDLCQDTYLKIVNVDFSKIDQPKKYLYYTMRNERINQFRKSKTKKNSNKDFKIQEEYNNVCDHIEAKELNAQVLSAIEKIKNEKHKRVLKLVCAGYRCVEIDEIIGEKQGYSKIVVYGQRRKPVGAAILRAIMKV